MGVAAKDVAIVRSIYDAALDECAWQVLPQLIATHLEGESAVIWYADGDSPPDFVSFNHSHRTVSDYGEHFRFVDPWTAAVTGHSLYSTAFDGAELISDRALRQSEFYYDFLRVADIFPNIGAHMSIGPGMISAVGVHRHVTASPFADHHKRGLQGLIGHLEQMLVLRRRLGSQRRASEMTSAALHSLSSGIVICDEHARILFANAAAESVAASHGALSLNSAGHTIAADQPEHSVQLRRLIADAAMCKPGGALCLANEMGDRLLILVSPLPSLVDEAPGRALVTLCSETAMLGPVADMLIALFGLTPAEADLASGLMRNQPLGAIQARRGVSENTIRTQLAHVFAKTRTNNQRELVRLLSLVPTSFEAEVRPV
jgi:DNA-binding CsgD family transcriptional regulator/PAS domain-containing protein